MFIQYGQKINECNRSFNEAEHAPQCHGKCKRVPLSDIDVDLHNESQRWNELGMPIQGVQKTNPPFPIDGIGVDLLRLDTQLQALIEILEVDRDRLAEKSAELLLEKLVTIRSAHQAALESRGLLIPKPTIIVPNGNGGRLH